MVKTFIRLFILVLFPVLTSAQALEQLDLPNAYELSRRNYPSIKQKDLLKRTAAITIANLQKGFLPQVSFTGQATYQSDVTEVPIKIPGIAIESIRKDQYKMVADVNQLIYDGGNTRQQKVMQQLNATVEDQKVEVELYKLKERINQLYLGILYLDEQGKQVALVKADIQTGIRRLEAQVQNGVAFKSNLNMLKAELLKTDQRGIEIIASRKGLLDALSLFIGQPLSDSVRLAKPSVTTETSLAEIVRPELKLYSEQSKLADQQNKLITAKHSPRASLFVQGGYGRPGLNMLRNDFDLFYVSGVRLNWSLSGLYTQRKEKEQVTVNKLIIDSQKETFLLNTQSQLKQQNAEIEKFRLLVAADDEIIALRKTVTDAAKAQLENGVITAGDYLREVNAEDQARQALISHELQLLQAQINYQMISGKQ
jgi:outer membrane protein TolC